MQAITTRRTASGNISARAQAGSIRHAWDFRLNPEDNHAAACKALVNKMEWFYGPWIGGCDHQENWVWVCDDTRKTSPVVEI